MGCLVSKPITDDTKIEIPGKVNSKPSRSGSLKSRHDFGVQIGTPFSKKRTPGKLESDDTNGKVIVRNGDISDQVREETTKLSPDVQEDVKEQPEKIYTLNGTLVAEQKVTETTEKCSSLERVVTIEDVKMAEELNKSDQNKTSSSESPITLQQKWLLQDSWVYIEKNILEFGMVFFARLLDENPGIKHLWSFGKMNYATEAELRKDVAFQNHSLRVMEMIGNAIGGLDDLEMLVPILSDLGQRHRMYGAKPEHFKAVHEALIYSYEKGLEERIWTADVKDAWDTVIQTVASVMSAELTE